MEEVANVVDVLLSVPVSITCALLSNWLELSDWYQIDTAYCNKTKRAWWFAFLRSNQTILSPYYTGKFGYPVNLLAWAVPRQIKFSKFFLDVHVDTRSNKQLVEQFMAISGGTLRHFKSLTDGWNSHWLVGLANSCFHLEHLRLDHFASLDSVLLITLLRNNRSTMKHLTINARGSEEPYPIDFELPELLDVTVNLSGWDDNKTQPFDVAHIVRTASQLRSLSLDVGNLPPSVLNEAVCSCKMLESVQLLNISSDCARDLRIFCPSVPALELTFVREVDPAALTSCAQSCHNIVSVALSGFVEPSALRASASTLKVLRWEEGDFIVENMISLLEQCSQLEELTFVHMYQLAAFEINDILTAVARATVVRKLTLFDQSLDHQSFCTIGTLFPQLEELVVGNSNMVENHFKTQEDVFHIAKGCPKLRRLDLGCAPEDIISPMALHFWKLACPHLVVTNNMYEILGNPTNDDMIEF